MIQMKTQFQPDLVDFRDRFIVAFQQLSGPYAHSLLSSNHSYVLYSPYCLYLWQGSSVDVPKRKGSLHVLKSFLNSRLYETINYRQSYFDQDMNMLNLKFRVEAQGNESQRFRAFF